MLLELGNPVECADAPFGELADVVVDPIARRVRHLVVEPHKHHALARLAPFELVRADDGRGGAILLRCTVDELRRLEPVNELAYIRLYDPPLSDPDWDVGIQDILGLSYSGATLFDPGALAGGAPLVISYDRVPKGEVEIRRASAVTSADGRRVGHVQGFLVERDGLITHLILERGHLWARRELAIPISAVKNAQTDAVTLNVAPGRT